jgi:DNA-binding XRE family transcriptional regulator
MGNKTHKRLPKILKINRIEKSKLRISVLFSNGEDRILDFNEILKKDWKVSKSDPEHKLLTPNEFAKAKVINHTLSWNNVDLFITGSNEKKVKVAFEVGADTLYKLSKTDEKLSMSIGSLFRSARLAAKLSQEKVAELSGTSRTYITKLENDGHDVEIMTLKKIVEAGLNKHLTISIE